MTYREQITAAMTNLAKDDRARFVGYGLKNGRAAGTLAGVQETQIVETPVAENLMTGIAIGLSLGGLRPMVYFERCDFILNALDAIVNHLDAARHISRGEFFPAVILRVVVGNRSKPLFTGRTHTQDFSLGLQRLVDFPVVRLSPDRDILAVYDTARQAQKRGHSTVILEYKDYL
jgi:pyruvate/2-oxoglutarate/acetoin dehydrogenase E1 component